MRKTSAKILPLGESGLTINFGNVISPELNDKVLQLAELIEKNPFPGFIETVPGNFTDGDNQIFAFSRGIRRNCTRFFN